MQDEFKSKELLIIELRAARERGVEAEKRIAELKRYEAALSESEQRFKLLCRLTPIPYQSLDENGDFIEINESWLEALGYGKEEVIGRNFGDFLHQEGKVHFKENFPRFKAAGEIPGVEFEMFKKDGSTIRVSINGKIGRDLQGRFKQTHCIFQDITERRRAEEGLLEAAKRLENTLGSISDAFFSMDDNLIVTYFNATAERILNRKAREVIGKYLFDSFPEAKGSIFDEKYHLAVAEKVFLAFECYFDIDPYRNWYEVRVYPQENGISVYFQIITERKQAETEIKEREERFSLAMEVTKDGLWDWDLKTGEVHYSPGYTAMLGYAPGEVPAHVGSWVDLIHPEDRDGALKANMDCVENLRDDFEVEFRMQAKSGEWRWIRGRGKAVGREPNGRAIRMVGAHTDISERKQAEEERKAHIRFLESMERIDQTIKKEADIEHMLSNILKTVFSIFDCDRAWLLYPCDPAAPSFRVPMEISRPEYPGAKVLDIEVPMSPGQALSMAEALESDGPVTYTTGTDRPIATPEQFGVQSQIFASLHPKLGKPWVFGMHQCSYPRIWTTEEQKLFKEISRRIADGLSSVLSFRELQENEERFRATFEQAAVGIAHVAPDGRWLRVNQKLCDIVGYSKEELLQEKFQTITHPDDLEADLEHIRLMLGGKLPTYSKEKRYIRKDGSIVCIDLTVSIVRNASGDPAYLISVVEDITERKCAEDALKEGQAFLTKILDSIPVPVFYKDIEKRYLGANLAFQEFFGKTRDQLIGKGVFDIGPLELAEAYHAKDTELLQNPGTQIYNSQMKDACGTLHHVVVHKATFMDTGGHVQGLIGVILDVTERNLAEEALWLQAERVQALLNLNQMTDATLQEITDYALEGAVRLTRSKIGYLAFLNDDESILTIHSWSKDAMGECAIPHKPIHYDVQEIGLWGEAVRQRRMVITNDYAEPNPLRRGYPTGHAAVQRQMNVPLFVGPRIVLVAGVGNKDGDYDENDAQQLTLLMEGMWRLIERTRAEEEKDKLQVQLLQAQKMESVGRLAGGVAHDFNNMLGAILGHAELAMMRCAPSDPVHAHLKVIEDSARRSADLTRQLLAFARKQTVAPKVLDLNDSVSGMLKILMRLIREDVDIAWQPGRNLWLVRMDPAQIDQILANLCVNARDAISGTGKVTIETGNITFDRSYCAEHAGFTPGDYVLLAISDNGCGMDKETQGRIFEPFFTTKGVGEGTGLGLATVYGIVKQNEGFINVYSEPGQGTTFKIYLPRHAAKAEQTSKTGVAQSIARGHGTILLVEDEPAILDMTTIMLERQGYKVLAAGTPGEAIRLAGVYPGEINLLMTDVVMPEMNGRELAKNLLSLHPGLKRLFMSGYTANVIAHHGVLDEGVNFIQKPFSMQDLAAKVRQAIGEGGAG